METYIRESAIGNREMEDWEKPYKPILGCLLQAAMLAARNGLKDQAEAILRPVEAVRPEHPSPKLARALVLIYSDRFQEAIDFLEREVLRKDPANDMAKSFTAMALHLLGRLDECRGFLSEVLQSGRNEQAMNLSRNLAREVGLAA